MLLFNQPVDFPYARCHAKSLRQLETITPDCLFSLECKIITNIQRNYNVFKFLKIDDLSDLI